MAPSAAARGSTPALRPAFLLALGLVSGLWGGVTLDREATAGCESSNAEPNLRLVAQAWNQIQRHYVDRTALNATNLTYGAIGGMVDALGDTGHSTFLSPAMVRQLKEARRGCLKGIGVDIQMKTGHVVVVAPLDGSPAQRAGLRPGDIILKVDGRDITDLPVRPGCGPHHRTTRHTGQLDHPEPAFGPHTPGVHRACLHSAPQRELAAGARHLGGPSPHRRL